MDGMEAREPPSPRQKSRGGEDRIPPEVHPSPTGLGKRGNLNIALLLLSSLTLRVKKRKKPQQTRELRTQVLSYENTSLGLITKESK